jgi:hypothetical protein
MRYLRITNRGCCPRIYLKLLGASTKSGRMEDLTLGGWFGSGTKFAPIAALNLGISVALASTDEQGKYFFQYKTQSCRLPDGSLGKQLVWHVTDLGKESVETETPFTLDMCRNWHDPIGDDQMRSFRVLREYLRNAFDENPEVNLAFCEELVWPEDGETSVYLSNVPEIREMLRLPERRFKYLATAASHAPIATFDTGRIFPKSEADRTRIFSQGTLAFCSAESRRRSVHDYCIDLKLNRDGKPLLTEERTFSDLTLVHQEVKRMLAAWTDQPRVADLIRLIESGQAPFEGETLMYLDFKPRPPAAETWIDAFHQVFDQPGQTRAVLSTNPYYDELARYSYGRKPIGLRHHHLRKFLKECGVPESYDCVPHLTPAEYLLVDEAELEDWETGRLGTAIAVMHAEFPDSELFTIRIFEPLVEKIKKTSGFTNIAEDPPILHLQRACLRSWDMILKTLVIHECRHGRSQADDASRVFIERADSDILALLAPKYGILREAPLDLTTMPLAKVPAVVKK